MANSVIFEVASGAKRPYHYLVGNPDENMARAALAKHLLMPISQIDVSEVVDADDFGADEGEITLLDYW